MRNIKLALAALGALLLSTYFLTPPAKGSAPIAPDITPVCEGCALDQNQLFPASLGQVGTCRFALQGVYEGAYSTTCGLPFNPTLCKMRTCDFTYKVQGIAGPAPTCDNVSFKWNGNPVPLVPGTWTDLTVISAVGQKCGEPIKVQGTLLGSGPVGAGGIAVVSTVAIDTDPGCFDCINQ